MTSHLDAGTSRAGAAEDDGYPGRELGLPETGPGSVAGMGRRLGALAIDWLCCTVISLAVTKSQIWALPIFAGEDLLLTALTGTTIGKRILGLRVARLDGRPVGLWAVVRTLLLLSVVAPLVQDRDLRGLHDRAANSVVVRF